MEVYKLGKTNDNHKIEIYIFLHQLKEARDEMQHSLKRRKEITIQQKDIQCKKKIVLGYLRIETHKSLM